jgi:hypothetical protein
MTRRNRLARTYDRRLCADAHAYDLWLHDFPAYAGKSIAVAHAAYRDWLATQTPCGHKSHPRGTTALAHTYAQKG